VISKKRKQRVFRGQVRGVNPGVASTVMEKVYHDSNVHTKENEVSQEQIPPPQVRRQPPPPPPYFERGKLNTRGGHISVDSEWRVERERDDEMRDGERETLRSCSDKE